MLSHLLIILTVLTRIDPRMDFRSINDLIMVTKHITATPINIISMSIMLFSSSYLGFQAQHHVHFRWKVFRCG